MAGVLAMSQCNVVGNSVYAKGAYEETNTETESNKGNETLEAESGEDEKGIEVESEESGKSTETESGEIEKSTETQSCDEEKEIVTESCTEEVSTEENDTLEETEEETNSENEVAVCGSENVTLIKLYERELEFDPASSWSDQGEANIGLKTTNPLNSGAKISFDLYIPKENADYNGVIKVQGVARLGDNWTWLDNASIPEITALNLVETVEIDGEMYKKANVSFTFRDEITADYLADFTVKLAGWQCDYKGNIYYANVMLQDGEKEETDKKEDNVKYQWVKGHANNKFNNRCDELAEAQARLHITVNSAK